jgi:hypothetical protein
MSKAISFHLQQLWVVFGGELFTGHLGAACLMEEVVKLE